MVPLHIHACQTTDQEHTNCLPPPIRKVHGRPKGSRAKSQREVEDMLQRVSNCRNCGTPGHRSGQCGNNDNQRVIEAGGVSGSSNRTHINLNTCIHMYHMNEPRLLGPDVFLLLYVA